jgi:hypothetical protein
MPRGRAATPHGSAATPRGSAATPRGSARNAARERPQRRAGAPATPRGSARNATQEGRNAANAGCNPFLLSYLPLIPAFSRSLRSRTNVETIR